MLNLDSLLGSKNRMSKVLEIRRKCENIIKCIVDDNLTIRECSSKIKVPKSTVHCYVHKYIQSFYYEDYLIIKQKFKRHKEQTVVKGIQGYQRVNKIK